MTGFRANGAMVATYWSVLVTVRMAQTEITETGIRSDARTIRTQAMIPRVRRARGFLFGLFGSPDSAAAGPLGPSSGSMSLIWSRSLPLCLVPKGPSAH